MSISSFFLVDIDSDRTFIEKYCWESARYRFLFTIVFNIDSENDIVLVEAFCVVIHTFIGKARLSAPDWRRWSSWAAVLHESSTSTPRRSKCSAACSGTPTSSHSLTLHNLKINRQADSRVRQMALYRSTWGFRTPSTIALGST